MFLLLPQVGTSLNQTLPQSAYGRPILWPTSGTRSRRSIRSGRLFRLSPCSSFSKYTSHERCWPFGWCIFSWLLTHCSVMFRFSGSPSILWLNLFRQQSAFRRHPRLHTVWYCAMASRPYYGCVSVSCRYSAISLSGFWNWNPNWMKGYYSVWTSRSYF